MSNTDFKQGWLVRENDRVLSSLLIPQSSKAKYKGLMLREDLEGALYFENAQAIHTFGMKFDLDVAIVSSDLVVTRLARVKPRRVILGGLTKGVIEARAGAFSEWELQVGEQLEIRL